MIDGNFEIVEQMWLTHEEATKLENERREMAELAKWRNDCLVAQAKTLRDDFEDLSDMEGFEQIVASAEALELPFEEAKDKLFSLKGKKVFALENKKNNNNVIVGLQNDPAVSKDNGRYGGIISVRN